ALAYELRGSGVTATVLCPGATATEFAAVAGNDKSALFKSGVADAASVARHGYRAMLAGKGGGGPRVWGETSPEGQRGEPALGRPRDRGAAQPAVGFGNMVPRGPREGKKRATAGRGRRPSGLR